MQEYRKSFGKTDPLGTISGDAETLPVTPPYTPDTPLSPYFAIKLGGVVYDLSHDYLVSMRYKEMSEFCGQMTFEIEDTMDLDLESKFMLLITNSDTSPCFQFGWQGMNAQNLSPWINFYITDYTPSFHPPHTMRISVQCQVTNPKEDDIRTYKGKTWNEIVTKLCEREGWSIGQFDEADPVSEEIEIIQANSETLGFIRREILPKCLCKGKPMCFWVDPSGGYPVANFLSIEHYAKDPSRTFLIYAGRYSNVLSFSPSYPGAEMAGGAQEIGYIDEETGDIKIWRAGTGSGREKAEINVINSVNSAYMKPLITNKWYARNISAYTATLKTVGSLDLKVSEYIDVIPFRIDGTPHYSAGKYFITEIEHEIASKFTTTYTLMRQVDGMDGISIDGTDENNTRVRSLSDGATEEVTTEMPVPEAYI